MTLTASARNGRLTVRKGIFGRVLYTVEAEKGYALCHLRGEDGAYIATLEREGYLRLSTVYNVYKGAERAGVMAAAPRIGAKEGSLPIITCSYTGRRFDGSRIVKPFRSSDGTEGEILFAAVSKKPGGWAIRFRGEHGLEEEEDAVLMLSAALAWRKVRDRSPGRRT